MKMAIAAATQRPEITQNRMITVVSGQPDNSKWWWIGDILNSRLVRPLARKKPICSATDPISIALSPQIKMSSSWVSVVMASIDNAAPMPSAPTSPMKMCAGAAFHHRKPTQAPANAAATTARSSGLTTPACAPGL